MPLEDYLESEELEFEERNVGSSPFNYNRRMSELVRKISKGTGDEIEKARAVFTWMGWNIEYKYSKWPFKYEYNDAVKVFYKKSGICYDLAILYTTLCRLLNLRAGVENVIIDTNGKKVNHACAYIVIDEKKILVDPTYKIFDVKHKKTERIPNKDVVKEINNYNSFSKEHNRSIKGIIFCLSLGLTLMCASGTVYLGKYLTDRYKAFASSYSPNEYASSEESSEQRSYDRASIPSTRIRDNINRGQELTSLLGHQSKKEISHKKRIIQNKKRETRNNKPKNKREAVLVINKRRSLFSFNTCEKNNRRKTI